MAFASMPTLSPGDRLRIVAPAGPFDPEKFEKGRAVLARRYRVEIAEEATLRHRYLAGPDELRRRSVQAAFDDASLATLVAARGGYGTSRLLGELRLHRPLTILGFSDITALHLAMLAKGFRSVHGPVVTQLGSQPDDAVERTFSILEGRAVAPLSGTETIRGGSAEGALIGGNLALIASLVGTPFLPSLSGAVVLLEDVGERPYRLDRMLTQLRLAGALQGIAGIVLGEFTDCEEKDATFTSAEVLAELCGSLGVPVLAGLPIGHGAVNQPVVLGARVRLDATARQLLPLEGLG